MQWWRTAGKHGPNRKRGSQPAAAIQYSLVKYSGEPVGEKCPYYFIRFSLYPRGRTGEREREPARGARLVFHARVHLRATMMQYTITQSTLLLQRSIKQYRLHHHHHHQGYSYGGESVIYYASQVISTQQPRFIVVIRQRRWGANPPKQLCFLTPVGGHFSRSGVSTSWFHSPRKDRMLRALLPRLYTYIRSYEIKWDRLDNKVPTSSFLSLY